MKTIQITIHPSVLQEIDSRCGDRNRSAFFRRAAELLLRQLRIEELERRDRQGYGRHPVERGEFAAWEAEQSWPE